MRYTSILTGALTCAALTAQPNVIPGLDGSVHVVSNLSQHGRVGSTIAVAILTTSCNPGSVPIDWYAPMDPRHPPIALLIAREYQGRFEQISNRGYVKHGFASTNSNGCGTCQRPPGGSSQLGLRCSDTYGSGLNASRTYLGPPDEINPWTGAWNPVGSHLDRGYPDVGPPRNNDGQRSPINPRDSIQFRVQVQDSDLAVTGARFWYQGGYVFAKEAEDKRTNNMRHREFRPNGQPGGTWSFSSIGDSGQWDTVLTRWTGATVGSGSNGQADGRIYVAAKVTGPNAQGVYRYNYAMHNRDNHHGAASLRIPTCPNNGAANFYFHDVDQDATNDWTPNATATEIAFLAGQNNSLKWNEIYSFGFDSTRAPIVGDVTIDQALPVTGGSQTVTVGDVLVPGFNANTDLGAGCGIPAAPQLSTFGNPDQARIPNPSFGLGVSGLGILNQVFINASFQSTNLNLGNGCSIYTDPSSTILIGQGIADFAGRFNLPLPVPNNAALEGLRLTFQAVEAQANGLVLNNFDISNGIEIRIGNNCP